MGSVEIVLPTVDKPISVVIGLQVFSFVVRILQRSAAHHVKEGENHNRMRKGLASLGLQQQRLRLTSSLRVCTERSPTGGLFFPLLVATAAVIV